MAWVCWRLLGCAGAEYADTDILDAVVLALDYETYADRR